jgi:hypothetical protein
MNDEDRLFEAILRTPWPIVWDEFILSGNDEGNYHVLRRHGWDIEEFIEYGIRHKFITKE